jgi:hypothetical protein
MVRLPAQSKMMNLGTEGRLEITCGVPAVGSVAFPILIHAMT